MIERRESILTAAAKAIARRGVRGLRVEEVARDAGVSLGLVYYHFTDRAGLLRATFAFVNDRAAAYTEAGVADGADPRARVTQALLLELQDDPLVIETATAWGELRASAVFEEELRAPLRELTERWIAEVAGTIRVAQDEGLADRRLDAAAAAARLTAVLEGLSDRWLSRSVTLDEARRLLVGAVEQELGPRDLD